MITELVQTKQAVTPPHFSVEKYDNEVLEDFYHKMSTTHHIESEAADLEGLSTYVIQMDSCCYIWQIYSPFLDNNDRATDEEHKLWKCDNLNDVAEQLVALGIFEKEQALQYITSDF